jgi:hypothetical protein
MWPWCRWWHASDVCVAGPAARGFLRGESPRTPHRNGRLLLAEGGSTWKRKAILKCAFREKRFLGLIVPLHRN